LCVESVDLPDANLIAVGEFNTILRKPPGGNALLPVDPGDLPPGNLLFIDGSQKTGWYVAQQSGKEVTVFHSAQLESGHWEALRKESVGVSFWSGANSFWIWRTPSGLGYAVSEGRIHLLDYATNTWKDAHGPGTDRLLGIVHNPGGSYGVLTSPGGGFGGIFAGDYLSRDNASTWQAIKSDFKVKIAPPSETPDGTLLIQGGVFSNAELHASKDGGATWSSLSNFPLTGSLSVFPSGGLLAVQETYGVFSVAYSSDGGKSWKYEYSNFNSRLLDRAKDKKPQ
jgi:hypothetical protein